ncbi:MAG: 5-(carboxyamino)imidazole ribonucleotide mutase [Myxococcota bacterium]
MKSPAASVLLVCGSPSDLDLVLGCEEALGELEIASAVRVLSAHRTPDETAEAVKSAEKEGFRIVIAFAGMSAALAGVAAAHTLLPVIGVPCASGALGGIDAALSVLQMPPGTPVAAVAVDGARNAALLAARILALGDTDLRQRLARRAAEDKKRYAPEAVSAEVEKRRKARREKKKS